MTRDESRRLAVVALSPTLLVGMCQAPGVTAVRCVANPIPPDARLVAQALDPFSGCLRVTLQSAAFPPGPKSDTVKR